MMVVIALALVSFAATTSAQSSKSKFYDFSDQIIDGEIKKPSTLYTNARQKVKFERLLNLKKSFMKNIKASSKDRALK